MIIILIGYMGSGKSSIGKKLSRKLRCNLIDLDDFIVEKEKASVKEIFDAKGEIYFRKKEEEYLKELLTLQEDTILSLGGGTPCFGDNMKYILESENTKSIYLKSSVKSLTDKLILLSITSITLRSFTFSRLPVELKASKTKNENVREFGGSILDTFL